MGSSHREAELEATIAAIADGVVIYRRDGAIANLNAAAQQLFGYTPDEWALPFAERMRRHHSTLVNARSSDPADLPAMRALHGETVTGELVAMRCGTDRRLRYLSCSAAPIWTEDGQLAGAVASFVDLTARHALEEELRGARDQLRREAESLEQRVQERTAELSRREAELEAANAALSETSVRLRASWEQTQVFFRQLVDALENERKAIARELHDQSGQSLTSLLIGLGLLQRRADCSADMKERLEDLKQQTEAIMSDLHRLSRDLRPASLDRLGLAPAVRQYLDGFARQHGLEVHFDAVGVYEDVNTSPEIKTTLYRIVQEALTNVARHARAQHVGVLLQRSDQYAMALIEDDGVGFDVDATTAMGRLGLLGMRERVEMLGGQLELESAAGRGTTIIAKVPLAGPSANREGDILHSLHSGRGQAAGVTP